MKYAHYEVTTQKLLGWYDDKIHTTILTPNIEVSEVDYKEALSINANFVNVTSSTLEVKDFRTPTETQEQLLQEMEDGVQNLLDTEAQSLGYDNIVSACSYMGSTNFGDEALSFLNWRDACWTYCYTQLGYTQLPDTDVNYRTMPTTDELLLELPARG